MLDTKVQVPVRMPVEMKDRITERAKEKGISRNEWVIRALEHVLAKQGVTKTIVTTEIVL